MQDNVSALIAYLTTMMDELRAPLETMLQQNFDENNQQDATKLLTGELTMIALLFTTSDNDIAMSETNLINELHRAVYGSDDSLITTNDYRTSYEEFLHTYPEVRTTLEHAPTSIKYLEDYDKRHGTEYAEKAKDMFWQLVLAVTNADGEFISIEGITAANFKQMLGSSTE